MKTAFITGVSRDIGLGAALVRKYLEEGFCVFAASRSVDGAHLAQMQSEYGDRLRLIPLDVTSAEDVRAAAAAAAEICGHLDVLISNATAASPKGGLPIDDGLDIEGALHGYDVNALGFLRLTQQFLNTGLLGAGSVIVGISSEAGSMGDNHRDANLDYGMAKAALNFACVVLQRRLGPKGMRVLSIHPGWVQTRPAPPVADFTPQEAAARVFATVAAPPPYREAGNVGVFMNNDGSHKAF